MVDKKQGRMNSSDTISASEIGQYNYCPAGWYLKRLGYEPESPFLEVGVKKHKDLGVILEKTQISKKKSNILAVLGYVLLFFAVLFILFEVI